MLAWLRRTIRYGTRSHASPPVHEQAGSSPPATAAAAPQRHPGRASRVLLKHKLAAPDQCGLQAGLALARRAKLGFPSAHRWAGFIRQTHRQNERVFSSGTVRRRGQLLASGSPDHLRCTAASTGNQAADGTQTRGARANELAGYVNVKEPPRSTTYDRGRCVNGPLGGSAPIDPRNCMTRQDRQLL